MADTKVYTQATHPNHPLIKALRAKGYTGIRLDWHPALALIHSRGYVMKTDQINYKNLNAITNKTALKAIAALPDQPKPDLVFQVDFKEPGPAGCSHYCYFSCPEGTELAKIKELAVEAANKDLERQRSSVMAFRSFGPSGFKPIKTVWVYQYDKNLKGTQRVRGGIRFRLMLSYMEATMSSGEKRRDDWYEPYD